jgi:maltose alpha-D-glucosyltransferase/alpha-amylase
VTAAHAERITAWLFTELPALALRWLPEQRWFGGKSRAIDRVEVEDVLWLSVELVGYALVVVEVRYAEAGARERRERYALVVGISSDARDGSTIGRIEGQSGLRAVEAGTDGSAVLAVLQGFVSGEPVRGARGGLLTYGDATPAARQAVTPGGGERPAVVPVGLEQSNTSIRLGSSHVFKLFRRLDEGENPQLEIGRFLAHTSFRSAPRLEGSLTYRAPDGRVATLGLLEDWIANSGDGWNYVVEQLERAARKGSGLEELAKDMFLLGTTTADFHAALASDPGTETFAPEPVTSGVVGEWRSGLLAQADRAMALVERHHTQWSDEARRLGRSLLGCRVDLAQRCSGQDVGPDQAFTKIRVHGDYHLGQTLKTAAGFALIDFEGEPTKSLEDRRRKQCALKDVAGMMRSFEYATETVIERMGSTPGASLSASVLREAFVEGYLARATTGGARFLPSAPDAVPRWIGFFELEKALYEVEYEVNNRPAWVHIPLRGVMHILQSRAA